MRSDVYECITGQIVAQLEKGVRPWMKSWDAAHASRAASAWLSAIHCVRPAPGRSTKALITVQPCFVATERN